MATVNGKEVDFIEGEILSSLLSRTGFSDSRIAVEINGRILPKAKHGEYVVEKDDRIEVVGLVGGG